MYPRNFIERFWATEPINQLFVCMSFDKSEESKEMFKIYQTIVNELKDDKDLKSKNIVVLDKAFRVDESTTGDSITTKICEGIANSKLVLIDLSNDRRFWKINRKRFWKSIPSINENVLYEAGIAMTIREADSVIIITEGEFENLPFDVKGVTINKWQKKNTKKWLSELIKDALIRKEWTSKERMRVLVESLDENCVRFIDQFGTRERLKSHFSFVDSGEMTIQEAVYRIEMKTAASRLVDLGLLKFRIGPIIKGRSLNKKNYEHSFDWTELGISVIKEAGFNKQERQ